MPINSRNQTGNLAHLKKEIAYFLDSVHEEVKKTKWCPGFDYQGNDLFEILRLPLFQSLWASAQKTVTEEFDQNNERAEELQEHRRQRSLFESVFIHLKARKATAYPEEVPVVFWPREPTHLSMQIPVFYALQKNKTQAYFIASQPKIASSLVDLRLPVLYVPKVWRNQIQKTKSDVQRTKKIFSKDPGVFFESPPWASNRTKIVKTLRACILQNLTNACQAIAISTLIFKKIKPRVLVVGNDVTMEGRSACLLAKKFAVKTVCLMHGAITENPIDWFHLADKFLTYGEVSKKALLKQGMTEKQVEVCGAPYLDCFPRQTGETVESLKKQFQLSRSEPWALVAFSGPGAGMSLSHHLRVMQTVMETTEKCSDITFILKTHRKDRIKYDLLQKKLYPNSRIMCPSSKGNHLPKTIFEWLQGCSLVITGASTVALEAMLMQIPVITVDLLGELDDVEFIRHGATIHVRSKQELEKAVQTLIKNPNSYNDIKIQAREFVRNYFGELDGRSSERVAKTIKNLEYEQ